MWLFFHYSSSRQFPLSPKTRAQNLPPRRVRDDGPRPTHPLLMHTHTMSSDVRTQDSTRERKKSSATGVKRVLHFFFFRDRAPCQRNVPSTGLIPEKTNPTRTPRRVCVRGGGVS